MNKFLLIPLLFASWTTFSQVSVELLQHYTIDEIEDIVVGFGIPSSFVPLDYEVDYYKVIYETVHPNGQTIEVSGALAVPTTQCPVPLASYQHGTVAAKSNVPSQQNDEGLLGILYASVGIAITMPDLIGLGESEGVHLYVHADSQASAAMDLIITAHSLQEELDFNLTNEHVIWGYSQGGHATMALQYLWEEQYMESYELVASAPMSGPYDMSGAQADLIVADAPYPTPGYLPYVLISFQEVYGTI
ncbi:MAG: hypothetical protein HKN32_07710, partial [Flavobacteriales bacterium]|nr:hypothetical protein [Flavobacteriales bacterium]